LAIWLYLTMADLSTETADKIFLCIKFPARPKLETKKGLDSMIFYACVKYEEQDPNSYKGIEVTTLGSNDKVAEFESYDPLEDYRNFASWAESVGEQNVGFCDTFKTFAHDYRQVSEEDSEKMISMLYGDHGSCGYEYY
jgi:hypothetical protein